MLDPSDKNYEDDLRMFDELDDLIRGEEWKDDIEDE